MTELPYDEKNFWNRVVVRSIQHKQSQITIAGRHSMIGDEPPSLGGDGVGPNPFTLVVSGLGLCTVGTLRDAARILDMPLDQIEVTLTFKVNLPPGKDPIAIDRTRKLRITKIRREIRLIGDLTEEQRDALMREAACCPVGNTLAPGVEIEDVEVREPAREHAS